LPPGHDAGAPAAPGRRRFLKHAGVSALTLAIPFNLASVRSARADSGQLRVRIGADISILDPAKIFQVENQTIAGHVFNGLMKYDQATNEIVPDLARDVAISDDGAGA